MCHEAKLKVLRFVKAHPIATAVDVPRAFQMDVPSSKMELVKLTKQAFWSLVYRSEIKKGIVLTMPLYVVTLESPIK